MLVQILVRGLALLLCLGGSLLVTVALLSKQQTIDLIMGKGDEEPGTNPTPMQDRIWLACIGLGMLFTATCLLFLAR
jgi:hypothetical protein